MGKLIGYVPTGGLSLLFKLVGHEIWVARQKIFKKSLIKLFILTDRRLRL